MWVTVTWVNYGKQPALRAKGAGKLFVGPTAMQQADKWFEWLGNGPIVFNTPDGDNVLPPIIPSDPKKPIGNTSTVETDNVLKPEDVKYILRHDESIAIVFRMQYFDSFGNRYWSDICLSRFPGGAFPHCSRHNEMH